MKKVFALVLMLTFVLSIAALADAQLKSVTGNTITIDKKYLAAAGSETEAATTPEEALTFTSTLTGKPATFTGEDGAVSILAAYGQATKKITVTLPDYTVAGQYTYTITESAPTSATQGVTYNTEPYALTVLVTNKADNTGFDVAYALIQDNDKKDSIDNIYELGDLNLSKTVEGNTGDRTYPFEFTVEFTADKAVLTDISVSASGATDGEGNTVASSIAASEWTSGKISKTYKLKNGDSLSFGNIPYGVTYTIEETAVDGYTTTINGDRTGTISAETTNVAYTNTSETTVDTGVMLDRLPYIALLSLAVLLGATLLLRRRSVNID